MIATFLIIFGIALIVIGLLFAFMENEIGYLIISGIGIIVFMVSCVLLSIPYSDCKNYCQCEGYEFHELKWNRCECSHESPKDKMVSAASDSCVRSCFDKEAYYNEVTGRCYCT